MREKIILASASPQRKRLLESLGISFDVFPSTFDEDGHPVREPMKRAQILAEKKAEHVRQAHPDAWIIGCDTLVVASTGALLEKPHDRQEAAEMLRLQSGGVSIVHSGLCLLSPRGESFTGLSSSKVTFKKLSDEEVEWWMETGLWKDRSGAFQIDGLGQLMIERIDGDWTGVVGLPVFLLGELAKEAGLRLMSEK
ncbi:septum formation protein Maf [Candidatus Peregrinibacteria bacterium]|nr:septum formation protein Maf [Candidatus Peregrinibacteria bacterium]